MVDLQLIQSKIYEIRGQRVMLDFDLAQMYGTETAQLKRAVRRNKKRFDGEDFMFEVNQTVGRTASMGAEAANQNVNKGIMRAFVAIRQLIANPPPDKHSLLQKEVKELKQYIEEIFTDQNDINEDTRMQLELINQTLAELQVHQKLSDKPHRPIGFIRPEED